MGRWKDKFKGRFLLALVSGVMAVSVADYKYDLFNKTQDRNLPEISIKESPILKPSDDFLLKTEKDMMPDLDLYFEHHDNFFSKVENDIIHEFLYDLDLNDLFDQTKSKQELINEVNLPGIDRLMKEMGKLGEKVNPTNLVELINDEMYKSDTPANEFLKNFPRTLNGTRKIEKYPVEGSKKCLIFIPQIHYGESKFVKVYDKYSREDQELKHKYINKCQKDINSILGQFIEEYGLSSIYDEAKIKDSSEIEAANQYTYPLRSLAQRDYISFPWLDHGINLLLLELLLENGADSSSILKQINDLNEEEQTFFESFRYIPGGQYPYVFDGKLEQLPGVHSNLNSVTFDVINSRNIELIQDFAQDRREFFVLDSCSKGKELYPVVIFGGIHDFKDNIQVWNKYHPDKKYSFIVVEPESFAEGLIKIVQISGDKY
jgi:hypothetical protein|tara:strand:- start:282 stop:1577 length:1296 start_codon:yes stop_codon:yes gene_type:complete